MQINSKSSWETNTRVSLHAWMTFSPRIKCHKDQWLEGKPNKEKGKQKQHQQHKTYL